MLKNNQYDMHAYMIVYNDFNHTIRRWSNDEEAKKLAPEHIREEIGVGYIIRYKLYRLDNIYPVISDKKIDKLLKEKRLKLF